jgi:hypothetical protein
MPSESSARSADWTSHPTASTRRPLSADARRRAAAKGASTIARHRQERRAERLAEIRAQTEDGTLIIRQMPIEPSRGARGTAERRSARAHG